MPWPLREHLALARYVARWMLLAVPTAALVGSVCALFLWALDVATRTFWAHPTLLFALPLAGVVIAALYALIGRSVEAGNNLIVDEIHEPRAGVPLVMTPLILIGTIVTHLFGGSAGREGTAVQIGGSLASTIGRWLRLGRQDVRELLMVGIAAGFAGVFGTPLAAAIFAMEVLALGRISYEAILPCLIAGIVGDAACTAWGIHHTRYAIAVATTAFDWSTAGKVAAAAIAFGLASLLFIELTHRLTTLWNHLPLPFAGGGRGVGRSNDPTTLDGHMPPSLALPRKRGRELIRPFVGGLIVIGLTYLVGSRDYLGLGVLAPPGGHVSIVDSFHAGGADSYSWLLKILFTAITLSAGFKGGEVTPLFFIGATLGHSLARAMGAPIDLFAALGFVGVFAAATNTPLACTLMGIELFGSGHVVYLAIACFIAYLFSGHNGIYPSQRIGTPKLFEAHEAGIALREVRQRH